MAEPFQLFEGVLTILMNEAGEGDQYDAPTWIGRIAEPQS